MDLKQKKRESQWPSDRVSASQSVKVYQELAFGEMTVKEYEKLIFNNPKIEYKMEDQKKKTESVKKIRFAVIENGQEVLSTSKELEASGKVIKLQQELKPLIVLLDHQRKSSLHFKKTINQKNYRIHAGDYEEDSVTKPDTEVSEVQK